MGTSDDGLPKPPERALGHTESGHLDSPPPLIASSSSTAENGNDHAAHTAGGSTDGSRLSPLHAYTMNPEDPLYTRPVSPETGYPIHRASSPLLGTGSTRRGAYGTAGEVSPSKGGSKATSPLHQGRGSPGIRLTQSPHHSPDRAAGSNGKDTQDTSYVEPDSTLIDGPIVPRNKSNISRSSWGVPFGVPHSRHESNSKTTNPFATTNLLSPYSDYQHGRSSTSQSNASNASTSSLPRPVKSNYTQSPNNTLNRRHSYKTPFFNGFSSGASNSNRNSLDVSNNSFQNRGVNKRNSSQDVIGRGSYSRGHSYIPNSSNDSVSNMSMDSSSLSINNSSSFTHPEGIAAALRNMDLDDIHKKSRRSMAYNRNNMTKLDGRKSTIDSFDEDGADYENLNEHHHDDELFGMDEQTQSKSLNKAIVNDRAISPSGSMASSFSAASYNNSSFLAGVPRRRVTLMEPSFISQGKSFSASNSIIPTRTASPTKSITDMEDIGRNIESIPDVKTVPESTIEKIDEDLNSKISPLLVTDEKNELHDADQNINIINLLQSLSDSTKGRHTSKSTLSTNERSDISVDQKETQISSEQGPSTDNSLQGGDFFGPFDNLDQLKYHISSLDVTTVEDSNTSSDEDSHKHSNEDKKSLFSKFLLPTNIDLTNMDHIDGTTSSHGGKQYDEFVSSQNTGLGRKRSNSLNDIRGKHLFKEESNYFFYSVDTGIVDSDSLNSLLFDKRDRKIIDSVHKKVTPDDKKKHLKFDRISDYISHSRQQVKSSENLNASTETKQTFWIDISDPTGEDIINLERHFGIHKSVFGEIFKNDPHLAMSDANLERDFTALYAPSFQYQQQERCDIYTNYVLFSTTAYTIETRTHFGFTANSHKESKWKRLKMDRYSCFDRGVFNYLSSMWKPKNSGYGVLADESDSDDDGDDYIDENAVTTSEQLDPVLVWILVFDSFVISFHSKNIESLKLTFQKLDDIYAPIREKNMETYFKPDLETIRSYNMSEWNKRKDTFIKNPKDIAPDMPLGSSYISEKFVKDLMDGKISDANSSHKDDEDDENLRAGSMIFNGNVDFDPVSIIYLLLNNIIRGLRHHMISIQDYANDLETFVLLEYGSLSDVTPTTKSKSSLSSGGNRRRRKKMGLTYNNQRHRERERRKLKMRTNNQSQNIDERDPYIPYSAILTPKNTPSVTVSPSKQDISAEGKPSEEFPQAPPMALVSGETLGIFTSGNGIPLSRENSRDKHARRSPVGRSIDDLDLKRIDQSIRKHHNTGTVDLEKVYKVLVGSQTSNEQNQHDGENNAFKNNPIGLTGWPVISSASSPTSTVKNNNIPLLVTNPPPMSEFYPSQSRGNSPDRLSVDNRSYVYGRGNLSTTSTVDSLSGLLSPYEADDILDNLEQDHAIRRRAKKIESSTSSVYDGTSDSWNGSDTDDSSSADSSSYGDVSTFVRWRQERETDILRRRNKEKDVSKDIESGRYDNYSKYGGKHNQSESLWTRFHLRTMTLLARVIGVTGEVKSIYQDADLNVLNGWWAIRPYGSSSEAPAVKLYADEDDVKNPDKFVMDRTTQILREARMKYGKGDNKRIDMTNHDDERTLAYQDLTPGIKMCREPLSIHDDIVCKHCGLQIVPKKIKASVIRHINDDSIGREIKLMEQIRRRHLLSRRKKFTMMNIQYHRRKLMSILKISKDKPRIVRKVLVMLYGGSSASYWNLVGTTNSTDAIIGNDFDIHGHSSQQDNKKTNRVDPFSGLVTEDEVTIDEAKNLHSDSNKPSLLKKKIFELFTTLDMLRTDSQDSQNTNHNNQQADRAEMVKKLGCCLAERMKVDHRHWFVNLEDRARALNDDITSIEKDINRNNSELFCELDLEYNLAAKRLDDASRNMTSVVTLFMPITLFSSMMGMNCKVIGQDVPNLVFFYEFSIAFIILVLLCTRYAVRNEWFG